MTIGPGEDLAWRELGGALMERRIELSPRYKNRRLFSEDRQIGYRLVYDLEENRRTNFARSTMLDIARAYHVTAASIERKLHQQGELEPAPHRIPAGEPDPIPVAANEPAPAPPGVADAVATLVPLLTPGIDVQVNRARMRKPDAEGIDIFDDPDEAMLWDIAPEATRREVVALVRAMRQHHANQESGTEYPRNVK